MEFDVYRDWVVRDINWCQLCGQREENGKDADLCAQCEALDAEVETSCRS